MLIHLKNVLGSKELLKVQELMTNANYVDGKLSAGSVASQVKHNQEIACDDPIVEALNNIVMGNLVRHKTYQRAALPLKVASPFYACYQQGMHYGEHIDDPVMGSGNNPKYRSDLALTIFLNQPDHYQGGELLIQTDYGQQQIKYPAGDAVMYPATTRHKVAQVISGKRMVAVTWVQSLIKDAEQRALLYQLACAREKLLRKQSGEEHTKQVDLVYVNLVRKWSEL
ncbi:MAG: Fe2+-dependent dioxygenase [Gammaproteobacteria bacterium]|nr:Fe2+-dependent dioxygenase [Gammaproteobacteria bacterium]